VKDCLAYLSLHQNPANEIALRRIINKPTRGVGAVTLEKIIVEINPLEPQMLKAVDRALDNIKGKAQNSLTRFIEGYAEPFFDDDPEESLSYYIREFLNRFGVIDHYRERDRLEHSGREANISELINSALAYPPNQEGLRDFLETLELDSSASEEENQGNAVTLITMHNTKGLEFPRVFITGMEEGLFPSNRYDSAMDDSQLEEERRLFYVAITRAMNQLYFTGCRYRLRFGRIEETFPSRFLQELPPDEIEELNPMAISMGQEKSGEYSKGTRVIHDDYGVGTVFQVLYNNGHQVIHVQFESGQKATLMPQFCQHKLDKLGNSEWD
jgi:DNA helicase-2/ATP-dependent DNA helicase PcrA